MFIEKRFFRNPFSKFGKFYNNYSEYNKKYIELLVCVGRALIKEIVIFSKSMWKGRSRLPYSVSNWHSSSEIMAASKPSLITWIGHSSFLIQIGNINILTDPIFISPSFLFPRILKPGISLDSLPKIDYVLISHNHWDHMSPSCLIGIKKRFNDVKFLIPKGDGFWFDKWGLDNFCEFEWWQQINSSGIKITFLPAHHWSQRSVFDQNRSLWGSWMIEGCELNQKIYFAGDTAYGGHFKEIKNYFSNIDVALMPVGPCEPSKWMCKSHMNAEDAGKAFLELNAKCFVPMHWGTFCFGTDNFDTPIIRLEVWWKKNMKNLSDKTLHILKFGFAFNSLDNCNNRNFFKEIDKQI